VSTTLHFHDDEGCDFMTETIAPPWTQEQVDALNAYQKAGRFHPFTCADRDMPGHSDHGDGDIGVLVATKDGWICRDCDYQQAWAHAFMADPAAIR
jgi:hypothetical protein